MFDILLVVLPVFIILGAGYAAALTGYLKDSVADGLNAFAVRLAVPVLLFRALYNLDLSKGMQVPMLASFYAGAFACFAIGIVLARMFFKRPPGEAVAVGFAATFSNSLLLGIPIIERAFGEEALAPAFGIVALHAPLIYIVGITTMELSRRDGRSLGETLSTAFKSIIANPLMFGIVAGFLANLSGIEIPEPVMAPINMLAGAALPVAIIGVGATLARYKLTAGLSESLMVCALALLLHPAIVLLLTYVVLDLPAQYVAVAVLVASMPPGMNIYIFASLYNRAVALAATAMLIATALSVVTISFWLGIIHTLLPV